MRDYGVGNVRREDVQGDHSIPSYLLSPEIRLCDGPVSLEHYSRRVGGICDGFLLLKKKKWGKKGSG